MFPGQQALLVDGQLVMKEVDVTDVIGWREGTFSFKEVRLEEIINELARWYDIEVFFVDSDKQNEYYSFEIERSSSLKQVMNILEKTRTLDVELKGRTVIIR